MSAELDACKQSIRQSCRALRQSMPAAEREAADAAIADAVLGLPEVREAGLMLCYLSAALEVSTRALLAAWLRQGRPLAAPRCLPGQSGRMEFRLLSSLQGLHTGPFGILEPGEDSPLAAPGADSVCVVPGWCFDRQGWRIGYGKGYYDRFLRSFAGRSVGLCYANCIKDRLPSGPWDVPVQRVVTERGVVGGSETGCVGARAIHSQIWEDTR